MRSPLTEEERRTAASSGCSSGCSSASFQRSSLLKCDDVASPGPQPPALYFMKAAYQLIPHETGGTGSAVSEEQRIRSIVINHVEVEVKVEVEVEVCDGMIRLLKNGVGDVSVLA